MHVSLILIIESKIIKFILILKSHFNMAGRISAPAWSKRSRMGSYACLDRLDICPTDCYRDIHIHCANDKQ